VAGDLLQGLFNAEGRPMGAVHGHGLDDIGDIGYSQGLRLQEDVGGGACRISCARRALL